ncbi:MAG: CBS domain-containing protein [Alphaproteobacteria bacterium]|nr:CBS domain-containing protein [Alphaproteobacteria bacterium]
MNVASILAAKGNSVLTAPPTATVADIVATLQERNIGSIVISDDGARVLGIVSERDIVRDLALHGSSVLTRHVSDVMTRNVVTCSVGDSVNDLMSTMTAKRIRHLPVIDRGRLCGVISIGDVVKCRLEEVESEANAMRQYIATG